MCHSKEERLLKIKALLEALGKTIEDSREESHRLRTLKQHNSANRNEGFTSGIIMVQQLLDEALNG